YQLLYTPHIASEELYKISGHLQNYLANMYAPMDIDGRNFRAKPMNCPGHIMIYKTRLHSYRELPLRMAELGTVYRYEDPGVLGGLTRVRGFTQDDAHIFCRPEQVEDEVLNVFNFVIEMLQLFGMTEYEIFVATRPEKAMGSPEMWDKATASLKNALDRSKYKYQMDEGGGAFYGPKIDLKIKDCLGRPWQCSTIQFDFNLPERFDVYYIAEDSSKQRPYMVHRALLGSMERFFGVLIEHYGGAFPAWLAPVQARVIPIADRHNEASRKVAATLREAGVRVEVDDSSERTNYKIREATLQKIPYMLVVGDREAASGQVSVRERVQGDLGAVSVEKFVETLTQRVKERK
ncbi:MAG: threonine--tRNA ligase, partial [Planctomycetota bacterium]